MNTTCGTIHVSHRLLAKLAELGPYPPGAQEIAERDRIRGTAFFPGGFGLWDPDGMLPELPPRPVVIVGHNWGTPEDHRWASGRGAEYSESWPEAEQRSCSTWWNLLPLLRGAGITPEHCFFTNAYMGLKADGGPNEGDFPTTPDFDRHCRDFLALQLRELVPGVVVAMGKPAVKMLARTVPALRDWMGPRGGDRTLPDIRRRGLAFVQYASISSNQPPFAAVAMAHTCKPINLSEGGMEEIALLRAAVDGVRVC